MKTSALALEELSHSVLAVPPLARMADGSLAEAANRSLAAHLEAGGMRILLYGGNANLYHQPVSEFEAMLDLLERITGPETRVIPSIGPDYGKMHDQALMLRRSACRTAMVLPMQGVTSPEGVVEGVRRVSDRAAMPLTLYLKGEGVVRAADVQALVASGHIWCIKYAVVRPDPLQDPLLRDLLDRIGGERIVSGMGERPVLDHVGRTGLVSFTTGSGCLAPRTCLALLRALQSGQHDLAAGLHQRFMPLENLRESISLIRVLHDAVSWSGLADMGPQLPLLSSTPESARAAVTAQARVLLDQDRAPAAVSESA
ncbi:MAG: dihydrodipicolinate synthase family protein [Rhodoferax sp.]|nr:dihydrodipicolinate synthase family protein [Rhodoferax sp.]